MKNIPSSASIILHKPITILNEGYEHLIKNFEDISNMMNKLNEKLKADSSGLNSFSNINKNFMNLKDNFSKFYNNVYESLNKLDVSSISSKVGMMIASNLSSSSEDINSSHNQSGLKNAHVSSSIVFTPKMKSSYDKVFNEFVKIEKTTKELYSIKKELEDKRKDRIKMLELKLQGFSEEIKNINFDNIQRQLEDLSMSGTGTVDFHSNKQNQINVNKSSKLLIDNNNNRYNTGNLIRSESDTIEINSGMNNSEDKNKNSHNVLINQILNLNSTKGDEMKNFIESLLMQTESEFEFGDTVQNLKNKK